jgi:RNA polymerase sigma factor (sigma-70 family)
MVTPSDSELLRDYAERGSESAFTEIVKRYMDMVYSVALRQVGSPDLAKDAAQSVFIDLARKARELSRDRVSEMRLAGWLFQGVRYACRSLLRQARRREARERLACEVAMTDSNVPDSWELIQPILDDALGELRASDRDLLVLRFFQKRDFKSLSATFSLSENAMQQRVGRALEKLRKILRRRGVVTTAAGLAATLSAQSVTAAPLGLAGAVAAAAFLAPAATTASIPLIQILTMTTLKKTLISTLLASVLGVGLYQYHRTSVIRRDLASAQSQVAALVNERATWEQDRQAYSQKMAALSKTANSSGETPMELLRLRGEVGVLRQKTNELGKLLRVVQQVADETQDPVNVQTNIPRESWAFVGFGTPENALQSYMWAKSNGDVEQAFSSATPEFTQTIKDRYFKGNSDSEISTMLRESSTGQTNLQVLGKLVAGKDRVVYQVRIGGATDSGYTLLTMRNIDGEWKVSNAEDCYPERE